MTPWWFLPMQGATLAAGLAAFSLRGPVIQVVVPLAAAAYIGSSAWSRRLTGVKANTWHIEGRRWPSLAGEAALVLLLFVLALWLDRAAGLRGAAAVVGVVLGSYHVVHERRIERRPAVPSAAAA